MDAVKKSKLNFDVAMQYVLETPVEPLVPLPTPEPVTRASEPVRAAEPLVTTAHATDADQTSGHESGAATDAKTEVSEGKKKKPSSAALKRKVPRVKEMIPDASDELILLKLAQVNGDVDKCILLLLEDPDAGTAVPGIEPLPSDSGSEDEDEGDAVSDDEIDSTGSFGEYSIVLCVSW